MADSGSINIGEILRGLPQDIPPAQYDSIRLGLFDAHVKPWAAQQGVDLEAARNSFMEATKRETSEWPRTKLAAVSAMGALTGPISGLAAMAGYPQAKEQTEQLEQETRAEAIAAGVKHPGAYQFLGDVAGTAPYWVAGMGAMAPVGRAAHILAGGTIQGLYDYTKSGGDVKQGLLGAAVGAGLEGLLQGAGGLKQWLTSAKGLDPIEADAIEATAKGVGDVKQRVIAATVAEQRPELAQDMQKLVRDQLTATAQLGAPAKPLEVGAGGQLTANFKLPNGQMQSLDLSSALQSGQEFSNAVTQLSQLLKNGMSIDSVTGDPVALNALYRQLEHQAIARGELDTTTLFPGQQVGQGPIITTRPETLPTGERTAPKPEAVSESSGISPSETTGETPTSRLPATPPAASGPFEPNISWDEKMERTIEFITGRNRVSIPDLKEQFGTSYLEAKKLMDELTNRGMVGPIAGGGRGREVLAGRLTLQEAAAIDKLAMTADGKFTNVETGQTFDTPEDAFNSIGLTFSKLSGGQPVYDVNRRDMLRPALGAPASAKGAAEASEEGTSGQLMRYAVGEQKNRGGSWVTNTGEIYNLHPLESHDDFVERAFGGSADSSIPKLFQRGWMRVREDSMEGYEDAFRNPETLMKAYAQIRQRTGSDEPIWVDMHFNGKGKQAIAGFVPPDKIPDFLDDPIKYARTSPDFQSGSSWYEASGMSGEDYPGYTLSDQMREAGSILVPTARAFPQIFRKAVAEVTQDRGDAKALLAQYPAEVANGVNGPNILYMNNPASMSDSQARRVLNEAVLRQDPNAEYFGVLDTANNSLNLWTRAGIEGQLRLGRRLTPDVATNFPLNMYGYGANRPLGVHVVGDYGAFPNTEIAAGGRVLGMTMQPEEAGINPATFFVQHAAGSRPTVFHEGLHGNTAFLGMREDTDRIVLDEMGQQLFHGVFGESTGRGDFYRNVQSRAFGEEVYNTLAMAIRNPKAPGMPEMIQRYVEADTDKPTLLNWFNGRTQQLLERAAEAPESLHKSVYQRKLNYLLQKTGGVQDLSHPVEALGDTPGYDAGVYSVEDRAGKRVTFSNRDDYLEHVQRHYTEPLNAPDLVDTSLLPDHTPRYVINETPTLGRPPLNTFPIAADELEGRAPLEPDILLASSYIRPFYAWLNTVAEKHNLPGLYNVFKDLDDKIAKNQYEMKTWAQKLLDNFGGMSGLVSKRMMDYYKLLEAPVSERGKVVSDLNITSEEMGKIQSFISDFVTPMRDQLGVNLLDWMKFAKEVRGKTFDQVSTARVPGLSEDTLDKFRSYAITGMIDPNDLSLARVAHSLMRRSLFDVNMKEAVDTAQKYIDTKVGDDYVLGAFRDPLQRQLKYIQGIPERSAKIIDGVINSMMGKVNEGIAQVNKLLPEHRQIEPLDQAPKDVLGKWLLFNYAGSLGGRLMVPLRDSLQLFLTTYPILGGKYLKQGMEEAFQAAREGWTKSDLYATAERYGVLLKKQDLANLYASDSSKLETGPLTRFAETMLKPVQWSHNSNRLVSFAGHAARIMDALPEYAASGDETSFLKESGMRWLDSLQQQRMMGELRQITPSDWQDFAYKAARELVEVSQWSYRRGTNQGFYKYALGRLFGQYGTWPLNYVEFARRLVTQGDRTEAAKALTRLVIAHGAVLSAAQGAGIDAATWVFTNPMAYGGSPLFNAITALPESTDFETFKGTEARKELVRPFFPMMFPGLAAYNVYKQIADDKPDLLLTLLGFRPLTPEEAEKGIHQYFPGGE